MLKASSKNELLSIVSKLGDAMECGVREYILLQNPELVKHVAEAVMSRELSLVDAYEKDGEGVVVVIENRFGRKCRELRDGGTLHR